MFIVRYKNFLNLKSGKKLFKIVKLVDKKAPLFIYIKFHLYLKMVEMPIELKFLLVAKPLYNLLFFSTCHSRGKM